jgi:hypothetical protein
MEMKEDKRAFEEWLQKETNSIGFPSRQEELFEMLEKAFLAGTEYERNILTSD